MQFHRQLPIDVSSLRWEISLALIIKVILLIALWFLLFRWQDRPNIKPDIAQRLHLQNVDWHFFSPITQEFPYVR